MMTTTHTVAGSLSSDRHRSTRDAIKRTHSCCNVGASDGPLGVHPFTMLEGFARRPNTVHTFPESPRLTLDDNSLKYDRPVDADMALGVERTVGGVIGVTFDLCDCWKDSAIGSGDVTDGTTTSTPDTNESSPAEFLHSITKLHAMHTYSAATADAFVSARCN